MTATLTLIEPETFQLTYDDANSLLLGTWPGQVLDVELRHQYEELLVAAQRHGSCRYWLLDMRARNWHMPSFGRWFGADFAAAVHRALGQPVFIGYVLSPRHREAASTPRTQATQRGCATHNVYPYFFDSPDAALDWLRHQQAFGAVG